jgi:hypothetical protein
MKTKGVILERYDFFSKERATEDKPQGVSDTQLGVD